MKKLLFFVLPGLLLLFNSCDKNESAFMEQPDVLKIDSTLITIDFAQYSMLGDRVHFIIADEDGTIIKSVEYKDGTSPFKIYSKSQFDKERVNVFMVRIPSEKSSIASVFAYLQVKKGGIWTNRNSEKPQKPYTFPLKFQLMPGSIFDKMTFSTDITGSGPFSLADSGFLKSVQSSYSDGSKIFVQVKKNNQVLYNFLDITKGTKDFILDVAQCTKISSSKTITNPGTDLQMLSYAIPDTNFRNRYYLGSGRSFSNQLEYFYPSEKFQKYWTLIIYDKNDLSYWHSFFETEIPDKVKPFDIAFSIGGEYLTNFKPEVSGKFDYYDARFIDEKSTFATTIHSPSSAHYSDIKFPDFSKCIKSMKFDFSTQKITEFNVHQIDNFDEKKFFYQTYNSFGSTSSNAKAVLKRYQ